MDFFPLSDPARHATHGKHHRKHVDRDSHRTHEDAAVEIHIRVQITVFEITVLPRQRFQVVWQYPIVDR